MKEMNKIQVAEIGERKIVVSDLHALAQYAAISVLRLIFNPCVQLNVC
jgi:hypothetical protein